ncbi:hypothetical protein LMH87_005602 [Akanthomyces muscarius]|uniref:Uncharacterized protein n=1 Tax=Akanthomyces muscarius TaxID=2231603 RepID=A0A9W8UQR1_AKAMU|nr:hypothetical protein LMH87_005602 [Akanthomyces muscarius]KAJ4163901.1 hypothetical protein LMH87_005602 [Akanthomyces muscarius]
MQWTTLHLTTKGYHWRRLLFRLWMIDRRPCQPKNCHSRTSKGFVPKITGNCVGLAELRLQLFIVHSHSKVYTWAAHKQRGSLAADEKSPATLETDNTGTKPKAEATPKKGEAASGEGKSAPSLTLDE